MCVYYELKGQIINATNQASGDPNIRHSPNFEGPHVICLLHGPDVGGLSKIWTSGHTKQSKKHPNSALFVHISDDHPNRVTFII